MPKEGTRDGYAKGLIKAAANNKNIVVLDAGVSDSTRTAKFWEKYPERFFNMGISEQDMVATAAGMAKCGKVAFATSFSPFLMGRTQDHVLVSVAYSEANVKLVGTHNGLAVGEDGPTAQSQNDIGMARAMPTMKVLCPADSVEAEKMTEFLAADKGAAYLRLGRPDVDVLYDDSYKFQLGKASFLRKGKDIAIIACGIMVHEALKAAELLQRNKIDAMVINMSTIKPIDREAIKKAAATGAIITAEDHNIFGGLGSAVAEVIAEKNLDVKFLRVGIKDRFAESDKMDVLLKKYGMDAQAIEKSAKGLLRAPAKK